MDTKTSDQSTQAAGEIVPLTPAPAPADGSNGNGVAATTKSALTLTLEEQITKALEEALKGQDDCLGQMAAGLTKMVDGTSRLPARLGEIDAGVKKSHADVCVRIDDANTKLDHVYSQVNALATRQEPEMPKEWSGRRIGTTILLVIVLILLLLFGIGIWSSMPSSAAVEKTNAAAITATTAANEAKAAADKLGTVAITATTAANEAKAAANKAVEAANASTVAATGAATAAQVATVAADQAKAAADKMSVAIRVAKKNQISKADLKAALDALKGELELTTTIQPLAVEVGEVEQLK